MTKKPRGVTHEPRLEATVWSQPPLNSDIAERMVDARFGSEVPLERMEAAFLRFSREHLVALPVARLLLMNCAGL